MLNFFTKLILKKYQPRIIGIAGGIGKTCTREAVCLALSSTYTVRRNTGDKGIYREILFTIIGFDGRRQSFLSLCKVYFKALKLLIFRDYDYPQIIVLEMTVERRGQMKKILKILKPAIGVITSVGPVYADYFHSIDEIIDEKGKLVSGLSKNDWTILNIDDKNAGKIKKNTVSNILTYGFKNKADLTATDIRLTYVEDDQDARNLRGLSFTVRYKDQSAPVFLPSSLGIGQVYAVLAGMACGIIYGLDFNELATRMGALPILPGRMNLKTGGRQTTIIDNTYQISPAVVAAALDVLAEISVKSPGRKIAIIGDMPHLGHYSLELHQAAGKLVGGLNLDLLIVVGEKSRDIARAAKVAGMSENKIAHYAFAEQVIKDISKIIQTGDLILIIGSIKMKMYLITNEITKHLV